MLRDIICKEMLETITSPKFVFTFLLCTILILISVYTGINNYRSELQEYNAAVGLNKKNLESQPSYQALAGLGLKITKPPQVLGAVVTGVQQALGRVAAVNIAYDPNLVDSKYETNPVFAVFGELDLTFIVKIVLSLFAILFTYDAIVGEKERGTLRQMLANDLPRDRLILGKALGLFISLLLPLFIPLCLGMIALTIFPDIALTSQDWLRVGFILLLFLLYISVFFTLGLFISSRTSRSSTSLLILLFIWVTFVTVIPKASVIAAGQIYPIPSAYEITAQKDAFLQEIQGMAPGRVNEWVKNNPSQNNPEWQEKFKKFLEDIQQELTAKIDEKNAALETEYQAKKQKQLVLATNISLVSPTSALMFGAMSMARTGIDEHQRFLNSVKTYKPVFTKWANSKMMQNLQLGGALQVKPDISDMPAHKFVPESLNRSLALALPDFVIMFLMIAIFFSGAFVSFLKYDAR